MDTKEAARQKIGDLVNRFRNTPAKQRDHYNEQQTREYFILPLFRALGWDTENPAEMSAEEQISRGFVDFGFYLNGVVKFYLETKKVSSDLNRPANVKQAINYAWIKGVTWAVLTDFEGLKVLNAEWQDNPERAVVLDLHYADFAEKGFDDLWLLSKESMLSGELDRVAEKFHLKIKKLPVNQYLLSNLTNWRKELFAEIRGWDKSLWATDARSVDNAVQRLLDRLIFIRTVEDRGIENRLLQPLIRDTRKGKNLFKEIQSLFRQLDDIYNATLFAEDKIDYLEVHNPGLITKIVNGLYDVGGGTYAFYDFNAIDADVLGAIYEQYLGYKAIDPDAKQAIDFEQEKRRKRKSQGIYYTPQFVVRYIVQNTLGKLLETGVDPYSLRIVDPACGSGSFLIEAFDVLDKWIRTHGSEYDRIHHRVRRLRILRECIYGVDLDEQAVEVARLNLLLRATGERGKLPFLTNIRRGNSLISDPAIAGDAAFDWQAAFPEVFSERSRSLYFVTFVTHNSRVSERMVTYGSQAGEPFILNAQDRLLMAQKIAEACQRHQIPIVAWNVLPDHVHMVIAAENEEALDEQVRKIKGASSFAFARERGMEKGQHIWAQKFNHRLITDENMLREVVEYVMSNHRKHAEHWGEDLITAWGEDANATITTNNGLKPIVPSIVRATDAPADQPSVSEGGQYLSTIIRSICQPFEEAIRIRGGFDVVIGNPPYGANLDSSQTEYLRNRFTNTSGSLDSYLIFMELCGLILRSGGAFGVIVPSGWVSGPGTLPFREYFVSRFKPYAFATMPYDTFEAAYVDTVIVLAEALSDGKTLSDFQTAPVNIVSFPARHVIQSEMDFKKYQKTADAIRWLSSPNREFLTISSDKEQELIAKLKSDYGSFSEVVEVQRGVTPFDPSETKPDINPFPAFDGTVRRYTLNIDNTPKYIRYDGTLAEYKPEKYFVGPRLLLRELISRQFQLQAVYTDATFVTNKSMQSLILKKDNYNLLYVLGILNSKLISWYFLSTSSVGRRDDFPKIVLTQTRHLPLRTINFADPTEKRRHDDMVQMVEKMLALKPQHAAAEANFDDKRHYLKEEIEALDAAIDHLVYELYGLTEAEIALVEGR